MKKPVKTTLAALIAAHCFVSGAMAAEGIKLNGFLTTGYATASGFEEPYLERIGEDGNTGDTHFGLNVAGSLDEHWSVAGQLYASGAEGNYNMILDWAFASYRLNDSLSLNMGRIKYPNLLVSDYYDVGLSQPWVRPPQEIYNLEAEAGSPLVFEAFSGLSLGYVVPMGDYELGMQVYGGDGAGEMYTITNMMGAKLSFGNEGLSVIAGYNSHTITMGSKELDAIVQALGGTVVESDGIENTVINYGISMDMFNVVLMFENATATADEVTTTGQYVTLGYRIGNVLPHVTSASRKVDDEEQTSLGVGIKYNMTEVSDIKLDYTMVNMEEAGEKIEGKVISFTMDFVF